MSFMRLKFGSELHISDRILKFPDVLLVNSIAHYGMVVKVADAYSKTEYIHCQLDAERINLINDLTHPLSLQEIRRLRHHLTRRIWMLEGVFDCVNWQVLRKVPLPQKQKLLPAAMCYSCMSEGNKYIPKQLKMCGVGLCRCCGNPSTMLHPTRLAWPVDLRHKGFGFTVIGTGRNYTMNAEYYKHHFDMSIYNDYQG